MFIEQVLANLHRFGIHPFNEHSALMHANALIDGRFHIHPGFNLIEGPGSFVGHRVPWTFASNSSQVESALFGDNFFNDATTVLQSVGLSIRAETVEVLEGCASYRKYEKTWSGAVRDIAGAMSIPAVRRESLDEGEPRGCETRRLIGGDAEGVGRLEVRPPVPASSAQLGIGYLRARTNGAGVLVELAVRYQPIDRGALLLSGNDSQFVSNLRAGFGSGPPDIEIVPPEGLFLTSLALGVSNGRINAAGARWSLGPEFEQRAGGNGGSAFGVSGCPPRWVPIGVAAKEAMNQLGTTVVGFFGMVCARGDWLRGIDTGERAYARTSFLDTAVSPPVQYPALTSIGEVAGPGGVTTVLCDLGSGMRGLKLRGSTEVERIELLYCNSLSMAGAEKSVGVGGVATGGTFEQNCWTNPGPTRQHNGAGRLQHELSPFFYHRSGARLDSLAIGCHTAIDDVEGFEDPRNDGLVPAPPGPVSLSVPVISGSWVDASDVGVQRLGYGTGVPGTMVAWRNHGGPSATGNIPGAFAGSRYLLARAADGVRANARVLERSGLDLRHIPHGGTASLSFRYFRFGGQFIGSVEVWVRVRENPLPAWTLFWSDGPGGSNNSGGSIQAWQLAVVDLGAVLGSVVDIQIRAVQGRAALDLGVDSIQLTTQW